MEKKIICIAGLDGSGKTTQAKMTNEWLIKSGFESEFIRFHTEPTKLEKMEIVKKSTKYLLENGLMLSMSEIELLKEAFNIQIKLENVILPIVKNGRNIIFDRYIETYDAYTTISKIKGNWIRTINEVLPKPDLYFFIDVPAEVCFSRIKRSGRRISDHETVEQLEKARQYYLNNKEKYSFIIIDGDRPIEEVNEFIREYITSLRERR